MKIVIKTVRDMVPKAIMKMIINSCRHFINGELFVKLHAKGDQVRMNLLIRNIKENYMKYHSPGFIDGRKCRGSGQTK